MRPRRKIYTLAAADADGFMVAVTGAINTTPWTTIDGTLPPGAPTDGIGHQTTLTLASGGSLAGVNITVTGTDAEGRVQTETIAGPSATTTMTKYFKTVTSVTSDATLGASTMDIGWTALCRTPTYFVTVYVHGAAAMGINVGGTINYTAQQSNDRIFVNNPAQWHALGTANCEADQMLEAADGCAGLRIDIASHTSGILYVTYSQARV